ncbi:hypothetical protein IV749_001731 [Salmonella enterica]|nr:hypothetical protein [Salmonella enterica]
MFWIVLIIAALFFSWRNYKKNKPLIAARIAEEKEKDRLKDLRRDTRRRQWALALADILARRNGLPIKGVELVFKLDDDKRRYLAQQVKKELGLSENLDGAAYATRLRISYAAGLRASAARRARFIIIWRPRARSATRWPSTVCAPPF